MTASTQVSGPGKSLVRACAEPGCRVPGPMVSFRDGEGRWWCISHSPNKSAKRMAVTAGALAHRRQLWLPDAAPAPDFQTKESIVSWAEATADQVLKAQLDPKLADSARGLALLALAAHDLANRDLLDTVRKLVLTRVRRI